MRKLIFAVIIMFVGTSGFSQGIDIDLGIKAGGNFSNIRNLKSLNLNYKIGVQAGIFAGMKFSDKFAIQADAIYSQEGATLSNGRFDLTYINFPVVLKYYLVPDQGLNFQIGPQYGILIEDNIRVIVNGAPQKIKASESDLSAIAGFGYDFPYSGFQIEGRFHLGFANIIDDPRANARLKYISLSIGYSFL